MATRGLLVASFAGLLACGPEPRVLPASGAGQGGEWVWIHADDLAGHGGVIVSFGGVAGRSVVIESDRLLRVATPSVPVELRGRPLPITLHFADGEQRELGESFVFEPR